MAVLPAAVVAAVVDVGVTLGARLRTAPLDSALLGSGAIDLGWALAVLCGAGLIAGVAAALVRPYLLRRIDEDALAWLVGAALVGLLAGVGLRHFLAVRDWSAGGRLAALLALALIFAAGAGASLRPSAGVLRLRSPVALWAAPLLLAIGPFWLSATAGWVPERVSADARRPGERAVPQRQAPRVILLVTLDTTRFDAIGYSGPGGARTPFLDEIAAQGASFFQATTPSPLTLPSHASMMTGRLPSRHGVRRNGVRLAADVPTLAEHLSSAGWRTGAFVSSRVLRSSYGLARGFEHYDDRMDPRYWPSSQLVTIRLLRWLGWLSYPYENPARVTTLRAAKWLRRDAARPTFLWIHYFDAHAPYTPRRIPPECPHGPLLRDSDGAELWRDGRASRVGEPPPDWFVEHQRELYLAEIEEVDRSIRDLKDELERLGLWDATLLLVVGDHGESFDHGFLRGHVGLFDSTLRVPLLLRWPGAVAAGVEQHRPVSVLDVYATILDASGLDAGAAVARSLLEQPTEVTPLDEEPSLHEWLPTPPLDAELVAARTPRAKLILNRATGATQLFALDRDPGEFRDLSGDPRAAGLRQRLEGVLRESLAASPRAPTTRVLEDEDTRELLQGLGYSE
jgi:arylsulfatase A-like enzyme